jgi:MATE family multidrug resistance protein
MQLASCSTRISNELGAGNPSAARLSVKAVMFLAVIEVVIVSTKLFSCRSVWGYAYSDEKEVVDYIKGMTPLLCLSVIMDTSQAILSGQFRTY